MTKQQFIDKWINYSTDSYEAMEFDLISVIRTAEDEKMQEDIRKIEERYQEEEPEKKAYGMTHEDIKKYIKSITFGGGMKGA